MSLTTFLCQNEKKMHIYGGMSKSAEEKQKDMGANLKGLPLTKSDLSIKIKTVKDHYSVYKTGTRVGADDRNRHTEEGSDRAQNVNW